MKIQGELKMSCNEEEFNLLSDSLFYPFDFPFVSREESKLYFGVLG
jgi:hypothetical protein